MFNFACFLLLSCFFYSSHVCVCVCVWVSVCVSMCVMESLAVYRCTFHPVITYELRGRPLQLFTLGTIPIFQLVSWFEYYDFLFLFSFF